MKVELNFTFDNIYKNLITEECFTRTLQRGIEYVNDENVKAIKGIFDTGLKSGDFETKVGVIYSPNCRECEDWYGNNEKAQEFHGNVSKFMIDELTVEDSSLSKLYKMYLEENNLEDTNEEKAKYALGLMNDCSFLPEGTTMSENVYLCSFPPHTSNWWVKFDVPNCVEDERYEKRSKGKYDPADYNMLDTERGAYPIGAAFDRVKGYPRTVIEKIYIPRFLSFFFHDCPNTEDRRYRDFLEFRVNLD